MEFLLKKMDFIMNFGSPAPFAGCPNAAVAGTPAGAAPPFSLVQAAGN